MPRCQPGIVVEPRIRLILPPVATPPPPWRGFAIRRGVYCRVLNSNVITAIPTGLFDFTPALEMLYGRLRPAMGRGRPLAQAPRSPATIRGNASPFHPACSDRPVAVMSTGRCRIAPVYDLYPLWRRRRHRVVVLPSAAVRTAGTWRTTSSRRYLRACLTSPRGSMNCTDALLSINVDAPPDRPANTCLFIHAASCATGRPRSLWPPPNL